MTHQPALLISLFCFTSSCAYVFTPDRVELAYDGKNWHVFAGMHRELKIHIDIVGNICLETTLMRRKRDALWSWLGSFMNSRQHLPEGKKPAAMHPERDIPFISSDGNGTELQDFEGLCSIGNVIQHRHYNSAFNWTVRRKVGQVDYCKEGYLSQAVNALRGGHRDMRFTFSENDFLSNFRTEKISEAKKTTINFYADDCDEKSQISVARIEVEGQGTDKGQAQKVNIYKFSDEVDMDVLILIAARNLFRYIARRSWTDKLPLYGKRVVTIAPKASKLASFVGVVLPSPLTPVLSMFR